MGLKTQNSKSRQLKAAACTYLSLLSLSTPGEDHKHVTKAGLLARASSFAISFPSIRQWIVIARQHLQLRVQLRNFTGFPIKPFQAPSISISTIYSCYL